MTVKNNLSLDFLSTVEDLRDVKELSHYRGCCIYVKPVEIVCMPLIRYIAITSFSTVSYAVRGRTIYAR